MFLHGVCFIGYILFLIYTMPESGKNGVIISDVRKEKKLQDAVENFRLDRSEVS